RRLPRPARRLRTRLGAGAPTRAARGGDEHGNRSDRDRDRSPARAGESTDLHGHSPRQRTHSAHHRPARRAESGILSLLTQDASPESTGGLEESTSTL